MIERLSNLSEDMREVRNSQAKVEQVVLTMVELRRDFAHLDEKVRHLFVVSDNRGPEVIRIDKRVASLERWHKLIGIVLLTATGAIGWGVQRIEYLYRMDMRIQSLELVVNSQNMERALDGPRPPATGKK